MLKNKNIGKTNEHGSLWEWDQSGGAVLCAKLL